MPFILGHEHSPMSPAMPTIFMIMTHASSLTSVRGHYFESRTLEHFRFNVSLQDRQLILCSADLSQTTVHCQTTAHCLSKTKSTGVLKEKLLSFGEWCFCDFMVAA